MKEHPMYFFELKRSLLIIGLIFCMGLFSCTKSPSAKKSGQEPGNYRVLVTWTGNPANLVNHLSPPETDAAQLINVDFEVTKKDTGSCCVRDKRKNYSEGAVEFANTDFLSNDSLWVITDGWEGVDTLHISANNEEELDYSDYYNSGPQKLVVPPSISVRIRVFPPNSQSSLLDTTVHMVEAIPPCTKNCFFQYSIYLK